jgi:CheY-like chemotaxis protein
MNRSHCPLGFLREEAQKTAAIGLRSALDSLRLRWSEQGQLRYDEATKIANEASSAWYEHMRRCETCRNESSALVPASMKAELVSAPSILLVDDNRDLLAVLRGMLQHTYKVAGALSNGAAVLEQAASLHPDVIILDISLGDVNGFEVARRLKKAGCPARIIFLTLHEDMDFARAAFGLGASGYVFKSRLDIDLQNAIAAVLSGGHFSSIK